MNTDQNNSIPVDLELRKLGLNEKEIRVYLSCLELKYSSVQKIAKSSKLSRPTTYRIIESLLKKELVSKAKNKKSSLIAAESPDKILGLLKVQKRKIEEQEREFLRIISFLNNKYYLSSKNEIRAYSGSEGINFLLDDFSTTSSKKISIFFFENTNSEKNKLTEIYKKIRKRLGKIEIRELHEKDSIFPKKKEDYVTRKKLLCNFSLTPGILIISNKLIYVKKDRGFLIENEKVISIAENFFNAFWEICNIKETTK